MIKFLKNKLFLEHSVAIISLIILVFVYFSPILEGKTIQAGDAVSSKAWSHEISEFQDQTGETYHWNNSMFSGMPWGLLTLGLDKNLLLYGYNAYHSLLTYPIFTYLKVVLFCYLALVLLGVSPRIGFLGAILYCFTVLFTILIAAGHQNKIEVMSVLPLILSGIILAYRSKYLSAFALISFGLSSAFIFNHAQMLYYFLMGAGLVAASFLIQFIFSKEWLNYVKASATILFAMLVGGLSNLSLLTSAKSFTDDTMRGKPILEVKEDGKETVDDGLAWDYAMNWSNGTKDFWTMLIPNAVGGSSQEEVSGDSETGKLLKQNQAKPGLDGKYSAPMYWGDLPGASGPYYLGAITVFLFVLFLINGKVEYKIGFGLALLIVLLVSLGSRAEWFNRFLFDYLPVFSKFRAPSSAMTVVPLFVIFPAMIGLHEFLSSEKGKEKLLKNLYISTGIAAGVCLVFYFFGSSFLSFTSTSDANYQTSILDILIHTRKALMKADAMRSALFILASAALIWAFLKNKIKSSSIVLSIIIVLSLLDLWTVNKRYLDADNYASKGAFQNNFALTPQMQSIVNSEPKGRQAYRVINLSTNTFNDALTSYHFNSIGGYSAIKLRRYQDMIDYHIGKGNMEVLNMLNAKYIINQQGQVQTNPGALGNAWFVKELIVVNSPDEEIEALNTLQTSSQAVILQEEFSSELADKSMNFEGQGSITLDFYEPGKMYYTSNANSDGFAVFSEVWYGPDKGWEITIDGQKTEMVRVNYLLRGLYIPQGKHEVKFEFNPKPKFALVSLGFSALIIVSIFSLFILQWKEQQENTKNIQEH